MIEAGSDHQEGQEKERIATLAVEIRSDVVEEAQDSRPDMIEEILTLPVEEAQDSRLDMVEEILTLPQPNVVVEKNMTKPLSGLVSSKFVLKAITQKFVLSIA